MSDFLKKQTFKIIPFMSETNIEFNEPTIWLNFFKILLKIMNMQTTVPLDYHWYY